MARQFALGEGVEFADNPEPRCACLMLLDTSGSMGTIEGGDYQDLGYTYTQDGQTFRAASGGHTRIGELNGGLQVYKSSLAEDPLAAKRVEVSVITFGGRVETVCDFTTVDNFVPPVLRADGGTPMGAAISAALDALEQRKLSYKANRINYYRPWVFLLTDGEPTDDWSAAAERIRRLESQRAIAFFPIGVGSANMELLAQLSETRPKKLSGLKFRELFQWLSRSQLAVSRSRPGGETGSDRVALPATTGWEAI